MSVFGKTDRPTPVTLNGDSELWFTLASLATFTGQSPLNLITDFIGDAPELVAIGTSTGGSLAVFKPGVGTLFQQLLKDYPAGEILITAEWGDAILTFFDRMEEIEQEEIRARSINHEQSLRYALQLHRDGYVVVETQYLRIADGMTTVTDVPLLNSDGSTTRYLLIDDWRLAVSSLPFGRHFDFQRSSLESQGWLRVVQDEIGPNGHAYFVKPK